jgi:hypothetical protein
VFKGFEERRSEELRKIPDFRAGKEGFFCNGQIVVDQLNGYLAGRKQNLLVGPLVRQNAAATPLLPAAKGLIRA